MLIIASQRLLANKIDEKVRTASSMIYLLGEHGSGRTVISEMVIGDLQAQGIQTVYCECHPGDDPARAREMVVKGLFPPAIFDPQDRLTSTCQYLDFSGKKFFIVIDSADYLGQVFASEIFEFFAAYKDICSISIMLTGSAPVQQLFDEKSRAAVSVMEIEALKQDEKKYLAENYLSRAGNGKDKPDPKVIAEVVSKCGPLPGEIVKMVGNVMSDNLNGKSDAFGEGIVPGADSPIKRKPGDSSRLERRRDKTKIILICVTALLAIAMIAILIPLLTSGGEKKAPAPEPVVVQQAKISGPSSNAGEAPAAQTPAPAAAPAPSKPAETPAAAETPNPAAEAPKPAPSASAAAPAAENPVSPSQSAAAPASAEKPAPAPAAAEQQGAAQQSPAAAPEQKKEQPLPLTDAHGKELPAESDVAPLRKPNDGAEKKSSSADDQKAEAARKEAEAKAKRLRLRQRKRPRLRRRHRKRRRPRLMQRPRPMPRRRPGTSRRPRLMQRAKPRLRRRPGSRLQPGRRPMQRFPMRQGRLRLKGARRPSPAKPLPSRQARLCLLPRCRAAGLQRPQSLQQRHLQLPADILYSSQAPLTSRSLPR